MNHTINKANPQIVRPYTVIEFVEIPNSIENQKPFVVHEKRVNVYENWNPPRTAINNPKIGGADSVMLVCTNYLIF